MSTARHRHGDDRDPLSIRGVAGSRRPSRTGKPAHADLPITRETPRLSALKRLIVNFTNHRRVIGDSPVSVTHRELTSSSSPTQTTMIGRWPSGNVPD